MPMNMMHVWGVRVGMFHATVLMPMGVRLPHWVIRSMLVLIMFVMDMRMGMRRYSRGDFFRYPSPSSSSSGRSMIAPPKNVTL